MLRAPTRHCVTVEAGARSSLVRVRVRVRVKGRGRGRGRGEAFG